MRNLTDLTWEDLQARIIISATSEFLEGISTNSLMKIIDEKISIWERCLKINGLKVFSNSERKLPQPNSPTKDVLVSQEIVLTDYSDKAEKLLWVLEDRLGETNKLRSLRHWMEEMMISQSKIMYDVLR